MPVYEENAPVNMESGPPWIDEIKRVSALAESYTHALDELRSAQISYGQAEERLRAAMSRFEDATDSLGEFLSSHQIERDIKRDGPRPF